MKKLMTVAATALCASVFANTAVESSNIVGYTTVPEITASQYVALGVSFENVGGGDIAVKDLVKVGTPVGGGSLGGGTDQIWRWNTVDASWTKYFWYSSRGTTQWRKDGESKETTDTIPAGETFFFLRASTGQATSLTLAGSVKEISVDSAPKMVTVTASQLAFMANSWPTEIKVADFSSFYKEGSPIGGGSLGGGTDQIWRWNRTSSSWTKYFFYSSRGTTLWAKEGEKVASTDTIPAGEGFFFQRASTDKASATISIPAPVAE